MPEYYYDIYDKPGKRMESKRGWEIYPKGLYDISMNIKNNYGNIPLDSNGKWYWCSR